MLIFSILLAIYVIGRSVLTLKCKWIYKCILGIAAVLAAFKFHILHILGGPKFFAPDLPEWILLISAWIFALIFIYFFILLFFDFVRLGVRIFDAVSGRKSKVFFSRNFNKINLIGLIFAAGFASVGLFYGTKMPDVKVVEIEIPNLPPAAAGMKIALLADLHVDRMTGGDKIEKIVAKVNALNPDMTVLLGDFIDGDVAAYGKDLRPLAKLRAPFGVFGVPGNHEYYSGYRPWMNFLSEIGIRMLLNSAEIITGKSIAIAGITDPNAARFGENPPDAAAAMKNIPENMPVILLAHQPKSADLPGAERAALMLSGHTHGGMILGVDYLVGTFNAGRVRGIYRHNDMKIYVNSGTGIWNGFPVRLGVPSEITLIILK